MKHFMHMALVMILLFPIFPGLMLPARRSAAEVTSKHARRLKASTEDIKAGVAAVSEAPSAGAIAKKDKMRENLLAAIDDGTWEARLAKYSLSDWKKDMVNKGIGRIAKGIDEASAKVNAFYSAQLPIAYAISDEAKNMPDMTLEDSIARATMAITRMADFHYKKTG